MTHFSNGVLRRNSRVVVRSGVGLVDPVAKVLDDVRLAGLVVEGADEGEGLGAEELVDGGLVRGGREADGGVERGGQGSQVILGNGKNYINGSKFK